MRSLRSRLSQLKMEEVLLARELERAHEGTLRYQAIEEETEALLDGCRTAITNVENALDDSSTVY
jgi:hypothetical protein